MALPTLKSIAVFGFLIFLKRKLRRQVWFWIFITVIAALHVLLILYVPWTSKWVPAIAIGAIDSVDFCIVLWILDAVGTLLEGSKPPET